MPEAKLAVIALVVVVAIVAIVSYFSESGSGIGTVIGHSTTIPKVTTSTVKPTTYLSSTSTSSSSTTTMPKTCASTSSFVWVGNGNFSTGTYYGWTTSGTGFGNAPLDLSKANLDGDYFVYPWAGYNGDFAATTYHQKSGAIPGNISTTFVVVEPYLNFQIYSPKSSDLYVEIIPSDGASPSIYYYDTLNGSGSGRDSYFAYASIDMAAYMCQTVVVKVVSNVGIGAISNENLFIGVGNFYQGSYPYQTPGIAVTNP
jgi:hypothetical protein